MIQLEKKCKDYEFEGVSLKQLAEEYGLPLYVYSEESMRKTYANLRNNLPPNFDIFFSMKANPNPTIVYIFHKELGTGVEIASRGELDICTRRAMISPDNIVFAGPGKTDEELEYAISHGIGIINAESYREIKRIEKYAKKLRVSQKVNLRVNPDTKIEGAVTMAGGSKKFGIDEEKIPQIRKVIRGCKYVDLQGVHVFSATQILDQEKVLENIRLGLRIAKKCMNYFSVRTIDIGSGLGIMYSVDDKELDLTGFRDRLEELTSDPCFQDIHFILESGRFLVGPSGIYLTDVIEIKESRGTNYAIVRGGINHFLRPALIGNNHPVINISAGEKEEREKLDIGGQLCTSLDFLAKDIDLPKTKEGDLIAFLQAGAYGFSESMPFFLGHPTPAEILVDGKSEIFLIRKSMDILEFI